MQISNSLLDYFIIFFTVLLVLDIIFSSSLAARIFKSKAPNSVAINVVNFLFLPYKTSLNIIDSHCLYDSKFPWFMAIKTGYGHTSTKFLSLWQAYRELWSYLLSVGITNALYFFVNISTFCTLYVSSSAIIEFYRDGIQYEDTTLLYILALVTTPVLAFTTSFLAIVAFIKLAYYLLFEVFSKTAFISLDIKDYLIYLRNYWDRSEHDLIEIPATVAGVHRLSRIDLSILIKNHPIISYLRYTFWHGFTTYLTVFSGHFYFFLSIYLLVYTIFFTDLVSKVYALVYSLMGSVYTSVSAVVVQNIIFVLVAVVCLLLVVAYYTLFERKVMGSVQRRTGPKFVGFWGILQPISDGLKLLTKEIIIVRNSNIFLFFAAPMVSFIIALCLWSAIPFHNDVVISDFSLGLFFIFAVSSLNVYGVMLGGWASRSQYSLVGALRATSQVISYELSFGFLFLVVRLVTGSFNLQDIVISQYLNSWLIFLLFPFFFIFLILMLAETNRAPYDLAEAEAELVAGFHTEYSAILFALFFLAEYANMFMMSVLGALLFLGGWLPPSSVIEFMGIANSFDSYLELTNSTSWGLLILSFKSLLFAVFFIIIRATLPRYRFDQLLSIGWKRLLPLSFGLFVAYLFLAYFAGII